MPNYVMIPALKPIPYRLAYRFPVWAAVYLMLIVSPLSARAQRDAMRVSLPAAQSPSPGRTVSRPPVPDVASDSGLLDLSRDLSQQLLPFEEVFTIAVLHSPALRFENTVIDQKAGMASYTKIAILQNVSGFASYSRGNQFLVGTGSSSFDFAQNSNGYRLGAGVQLPVADLLGRRYKIQQARAEYEGALAQRDVARLSLKRELNRVYQGMLSAQRTLRIRLRDEQAALMAFRVAEVDMQQGKISPADYARYSNQYAIAQVVTEQERSGFMLSFRDLEILVGVPMHQLMNDK